MADHQPTFLHRLSIALRCLLRALGDPNLATVMARALVERGPPDSGRAGTAAVLREPPPEGALLLLGLLQKEGRVVDFLQQDLSGFSDHEVGAAARVVHAGCRQVLADHFTIVPVREEPEGSEITLAPGFDAACIRPTGNLVGDPPFTGRLVHRGWRVSEVRLPKVQSIHDFHTLAVAEVEL